MINFDLTSKLIFLITLVFTVTLISVQGAPAELQNEETTKNCSDSDGSQNEENKDDSFIIDQSQNGTENIRVKVKDVVIIWAPADSLLAATALLSSQILGPEDFEFEKPQNGQLPEHPPVIENQVQQNSSKVELPEKGNQTDSAILNPTTSPVIAKRGQLRYPGFLNTFLKRKQ